MKPPDQSLFPPFPTHTHIHTRTLAGIGAAYGTAKTGVGVSVTCVEYPRFVMKSIIPVAMAGVRGIYGLVGAVVILAASKSLVKYSNLFPEPQLMTAPSFVQLTRIPTPNLPPSVTSEPVWLTDYRTSLPESRSAS